MVDHTAKLGVKVLVLPEYAFAGEYILSASEAALQADQAASHLSAVAGIAAKYGMSDCRADHRAGRGRSLCNDRR